MTFLAEIWGGEDYVPRLWDDWLYQEQGCFGVAELSGKVVGLGHLGLIVDGQWWLEGLRVDPGARGQGIGSQLHDYFVDRWLEIGGDVVRLATHVHRTAVRKICERTGFQQVAEFIPLHGRPLSNSDSEITELESPDWMAAVADFEGSQANQAFAGLVDYQWQFAKAGPGWIGVEPRDSLLLDAADEYYAVRVADREGDVSVHLLATTAAGGNLEAGLRAVLDWAASQQADEITWLAPNLPAFTEPGISAGFEADDQGALLIYERHQ